MRPALVDPENTLLIQLLDHESAKRCPESVPVLALIGKGGKAPKPQSPETAVSGRQAGGEASRIAAAAMLLNADRAIMVRAVPV
jgi:hypothetical protein